MQSAVILHDKSKRETYALRAKCSTIPDTDKENLSKVWMHTASHETPDYWLLNGIRKRMIDAVNHSFSDSIQEPQIPLRLEEVVLEACRPRKDRGLDV